jgi:hypothetical protein
VFSINIPPCCHIFFTYITYLDIKIIHQRIQTTRSHASHCHRCQCCNVDFVLFHSVTCYTNPLLSRIHIDIANLLNITCTLVAIGMILWRLERIFELQFTLYIWKRKLMSQIRLGFVWHDASHEQRGEFTCHCVTMDKGNRWMLFVKQPTKMWPRPS